MTEQTHDYEILRNRQSEYATWSRFLDRAGMDLAVSLERPFVDVDNDGRRDANVSRYQQGLYRCDLRISRLNGGDGKRDYDVWQFVGVPDIIAAQIHRATWPWELEGCVGIGTAFDDVLYERHTVLEGTTHPREYGLAYPGMTGSENAFHKFMKDSLALCAREKRDHIWVRVTDRFDAPAGTFA